MNRGFEPRAEFRWFLLLLLSFPIALATVAYVWSLGSVIVVDPDDQIDGVFQQNSEAKLEMSKFPGRVYASTVKIEGEAVVRCRIGTEISLGYVTTTIHEWRIIRPYDCRSRPRAARE